MHDLFTITGRSDAHGCTLAQPNFAAAIAANNIIFRIPTPTFGLGLVENVSDTGLQTAFQSTAQQKGSLGISGNFNISGNTGNVTRFGWKAQNPSLLVFSGEAYNVEMGVTNDAFPEERNSPPPSCQLNPLPEDTTNLTDTTNGVSPASGVSSDIVNFAAFMRMLAAPTPANGNSPATATATTSSTTTSSTTAAPVEVADADPTSVLSAASGTSSTSAATTGSTTSTGSTASLTRGQQVFANIGCQACHVISQTTGNSEIGAAATNVTFQPLSDFALHNMGTGLADRVAQGAATGSQFRSAPLWGVGQRIFFLHDGRTTDLRVAIEQHSSSGSEANTVINNFNMLSVSDQQSLLNYLRSL
ncbi:MAG: di-heme oxidoredictase family protein [Xanthobacteraceae bacterium]